MDEYGEPFPVEEPVPVTGSRQVKITHEGLYYYNLDEIVNEDDPRLEEEGIKLENIVLHKQGVYV